MAHARKVEMANFEPKFNITFEVDPYQADLMVWLYSYLEDRELDDIFNLESINNLFDKIWDEAESFEAALLSREGEKGISPHFRLYLNAAKESRRQLDEP